MILNQMNIIDRIAECNDGKRHERMPGHLAGITIHRIQFDAPYPEAKSAVDIAKGFRDESRYAPGSYTGGEMPYSFVPMPNGSVEQALEVGDVGPHARKWNVPTIGIAALGDFTRYPYTIPQWSATAVLCAWLCVYIGGWPGGLVRGHDERPGGSADPTKKCPGKFWDMDKFRALAASRVAEIRASMLAKGELPESELSLLAEKALLGFGVVF